MTDITPTWAQELWRWTKENDLPNWIAVAFASFIWPIAVLAWSRRKVNNVPGLEVKLGRGDITIGDRHHSAISIDFVNHTGSVVYLTGVRIKPKAAAFPVPIDASPDIAEGTHHLLFLNDAGRFVLHELTLQTNESRRTTIAVSSPMPEAFYTFKPTWLRQKLRLPTYFILEFIAMVGTTRYRVATIR